jgi:GT2 family glycosyltransferase
MPLVSDPFTGKLAVNELPTGYSPQEINAWCEANLRAYSPAQIPLINGFCYGISERVLSRVGFLDEEAFPRGYGEEDDLSLRAGAAGFTLAVAVDTYIYHAKSKSFGSAKRSELVKHGSKSLTTKHGEKRLSRALRASQQNPALWIARREFARKFGNGVFTAPPPAEAPRLASNESAG